MNQQLCSGEFARHFDSRQIEYGSPMLTALHLFKEHVTAAASTVPYLYGPNACLSPWGC